MKFLPYLVEYEITDRYRKVCIEGVLTVGGLKEVDTYCLYFEKKGSLTKIQNAL